MNEFSPALKEDAPYKDPNGEYYQHRNGSEYNDSVADDVQR